MKRSLGFLLGISLSLLHTLAFCQGGPPLLTDDSGVPGNGNWENNFALEFDGSRNDYIKSFPIIDLNYGLGSRIQLKVEMNWISEKGEPIATKFDNLLLGCKYRIIDGGEDDFSLSVYPQPIISFNPESGGKTVALGIILPAAINKKFAGVDWNFQAGYQILGNNPQCFLGLSADHEFGESFTLLAELYSNIKIIRDGSVSGEDAIHFKPGAFFNIGGQIKLSDDYIVLLAIGKDLQSPPLTSPDAKFYGYVGLQLHM